MPPIDRTALDSYRPPVEVAPGVYRLRLPQPGFAANYAYALLGRVPTLVDSGHSAPGTQRHLDRGLADLGLLRSDFAQVLYTHTHLDHLGGGMVSWQRPDLAHVHHLLSARALDDRVDVDFGAYTHRLHDWDPWLQTLPAHPLLSPLRERRRQRKPDWLLLDRAAGHALHRPGLTPGEELDAGDGRVLVVEARGHDPYHLAFLDRDGAWAMTGDVVLRTPTPLVPAMDDDAGDYRDTLSRLAGLAPARVLPAHGPVLVDGPAAIARAASWFDRLGAALLEVVRSRPERGVHPADALQALLDRDRHLRPLVPAFLGVLVGVVHSHLMLIARNGDAVEVDGVRYLPVETPALRPPPSRSGAC